MHATRILPSRTTGELLALAAEETCRILRRQRRELTKRADTRLGEHLQGGLVELPEAGRGEAGQEPAVVAGEHHQDALRSGHACGDARRGARIGHANGDVVPQVANGRPDGLGNPTGAHAVQLGEVEDGFVDGQPLDRATDLPQGLVDQARGIEHPVEPAREECRVGAQARRIAQSHSRNHATRHGIDRRRDHTAGRLR